MNTLLCAALAGCSLTIGLSARAQVAPEPSSRQQVNAAPTAAPDAEQGLEKAINDAGYDAAKVVHNLEDYLQRFPDSPQKAAVYHTLVQSCQQIRDDACVLGYAEKLIAIQPDDAQTLMTAVALLQQRGDPESLARANAYVSTVIAATQRLSPDQKPDRLSPAEWQRQRDKLLLALFNVRGDIERAQANDEAAARDHYASFSTLANPAAAKALGDIAESRKDWGAAAHKYALALALPDIGPTQVNRADVLARLKSAWQQSQGNLQGLGDALLSAYDQALVPGDAPNAAAKPKSEAKDLFAFTVRGMDGAPKPLAQFKGKVVVLSFWATWCAPCNLLEPILGDIARQYSGDSKIAFLGVNSDEDETRVPHFLQRVKWELPLAYSDGLKEYLGVNAFPTVIILDPDGKTIYRVSGFTDEGYVNTLTAALQSVAGPPPTSHPTMASPSLKYP